MSRVLVLLLATVLLALADDNAAAILQRYVAAEKENATHAAQYTYSEKETTFRFDSHGTPRVAQSKTWDVLFVEGKPYRKLVAHDDQPLSAREAAKEDERLQKTAEERRRNHHLNPFSKTVTVARTSEMTELYSCRIENEEDLQGRRAWVIACDPKPGLTPADKRQQELLSLSRKMWIDQTSCALLKAVDTALEGHPVMQPGSTISTQFALINNDAWLPVSGLIEGHARVAKLISGRARTEYEYSHFQKFDVQSTVTPQ